MVDDPDSQSSGHRAAGEPTQPEVTGAGTADTLLSAGDVTAPVPLAPAGYQIGEVIGRGGMGEVVTAHDQRIGRDVAIKRMRSATPDGEQLARFLREARIQARLDHPAIVPVHEVGTDEHGRPFFTMKRVSGVTLAQQITAGAPRQRLLRALVDVGHAIDLAHSRGVVHRDLKPANIMLGDYGEVYVLDWGVARVLADHKHVAVQTDVDTLEEGTQTGAMLGTPGYMSPEQIRGIPATEAADVYALGSMLFEILAGEPLHPRGQPAIASTLSTPQDSPLRRQPERAVPPELDTLCRAALSESPPARPTARAFADGLQAYLDGDRDLAQRKRVAGEKIAMAKDALARGGAGTRAAAISYLGHAVTLDPESTEAAPLLASLLLEPPAELPPELTNALAREDRKATLRRSKLALYAYGSLYGFWLAFPFLGIKSWPWLLALYGVITANVAYTWLAARSGKFNVLIGLSANLVLAVAWSRLAGLFLLTPVLLCGVLLALTSSTVLYRRPWIVVAWTTAAFLIPAGLEHLGVLQSTWEVTLTSIISHSTIFEMQGWIGNVSLLATNIIFVTIIGLVGVKVHAVARDARHDFHIYAWHLRQLLPRQFQTRT